METRPDVLVVSGEPLWPAYHGGRVRASRIVDELARHMAVRVVAPVEAPPPVDLPFDALPTEQPVRRSASVRPGPRLGQALLGPRRSTALADLVARHQPKTVLFSPSYLAAVAPDLGIPFVVDFHDVEVQRMRSLAGRGPARSRAGYAIEALKARRWEPPVARRARLTTATCAADVAGLVDWGASALLVPNGADRHELRPSPALGPVTFVASFSYRPNLDATRFFLGSVWPRLRESEPALTLRLVGRQAATATGRWVGGPGVEIVSDPPDVERYYREASVVVAPVDAGGGAQLKVTEALARNRVVVATPFAARAAPAAAAAGLVVAEGPADFARCVLGLWRDIPARHAREHALADRRPVPTWEQACAPLVQALAELVPHR